jgi:predicted nucleic acid-binding protein
VPTAPRPAGRRGAAVLLVDTSVWIETLRRPARLTLAEVGDFDEIVTCLPVVQEVLQGFRDEQAFRKAREAMLALPIVESPLGAALFAEAVGLYRAARRAGFTPRSSVDCLIAACALRHGLTVVHVDRDYTALARIAPLSQRALRPSA